MSITYVGGITTTSDCLSGATVSLTSLTGGSDSSASAGDVVIAAVSKAATGLISTTISGYVKIAESYSDDNTDTNFSFFYKVMGPTPDTSFVVPSSGANFNGLTVAVQVWRGVDPARPLDVLSTSASGINTGQPNPPAITPSTSGAIIIAAGGNGGNGGVFTSSDLSNFITAFVFNSQSSTIGMGSYAWSSGAFDPAQFGGGTTSVAASWGAATLALRPAQSSVALDSNVIAYWKLDESSGNAADATGNGYTLTNTNTVGYATGLINNGADFGNNNTNKYLRGTLVDPDSYNSGFSISFWVNWNASPSADDIFGWQDSSWSGVWAGFANATTAAFRFGNGVTSDGGTSTFTVSTLSTGVWYHFVMVHYAGANIYYMDGVPLGGRGNAVTLSGSGTGFDIGKTYSATVNYASVKVDEFGIWGRALSQTEVLQLYNGGSGIQYPFPLPSIKNINGLTVANTKTVNGLAIANIKNINGLE